MRVSRLRGLLLWEVGGITFSGKTRALSISIVRPAYWQFRINRWNRLREFFFGPFAVCIWSINWGD